MKRIYFYTIAALLFIGFAIATSSCSPKTGCAINEDAHVKVNRKGEMPTKRGKSNLFSKKTRRKMH
jgi:hypothetical protein